MAKNMQNTGYRKLDVDAYDPENYNENDEGRGNFRIPLSRDNLDFRYISAWKCHDIRLTCLGRKAYSSFS